MRGFTPPFPPRYVHAFITPSLRLHCAFITPSLRLHYAFITPSLRLHYAFITPSLRLYYAFIMPSLRLHYAFITPSFLSRIGFIIPTFRLFMLGDLRRFLLTHALALFFFCKHKSLRARLCTRKVLDPRP